jgi:predicted nucleotidyltransferase
VAVFIALANKTIPPMRLSPTQQKILVTTAQQIFGNLATVRLFGSRTDDNLRGGDIDLLIELPTIEPLRQKKSLTYTALLQQELGDQPIDVIVIDPSVSLTPFHQQALQTGILLHSQS